MGNITGTPDFTEGFNNSGIKHLEFYQTAATSAYANGSAQDVVFDTQFKLNGFTTEYNNSTGIFTASEAGYYLCSCGLTINSTTTGDLRRVLTYFNINGAGETDILSDLFFTSDQDLNQYLSGGCKVIQLNASDTLRVSNYCDTSGGTWFVNATTPVRRTFLTITKIG